MATFSANDTNPSALEFTLADPLRLGTEVPPTEPKSSATRTKMELAKAAIIVEKFLT